MFAYQWQSHNKTRACITVREEEAALVESWRCHAQGPKRIPFYHFSPQITFFAVAAADCLLDREQRKG